MPTLATGVAAAGVKARHPAAHGGGGQLAGCAAGSPVGLGGRRHCGRGGHARSCGPASAVATASRGGRRHRLLSSSPPCGASLPPLRGGRASASSRLAGRR
ncbi:hypothetical protein I4F81_004373 [Pyropia yezoensis]|uniref:Uncharacterized protein n=1 Tax=Pyropia yezoensis TaxID=2788 RepID=A0ACC3BVZ1_PYRYE|nr:hypothetical protein I4F81_004373 [Neopyropia yezoensis]